MIKSFLGKSYKLLSMSFIQILNYFFPNVKNNILAITDIILYMLISWSQLDTV